MEAKRSPRTLAQSKRARLFLDTRSVGCGTPEFEGKAHTPQAPGGSSTGSAVAVAAGFSPLAMGTETIGSIITPTSRAALYALKPTAGVQDTTGLYSLTDFFDSPGPMAKSSADLALLTEILLDRLTSYRNLPSWERNWRPITCTALYKIDARTC